MPNPFLRLIQWSRPEAGATNPRLASPIDSTTTTIVVTNPPLDHADAIITGNFLMGIRSQDSYVEHVYVPAAAVSADGLTFTGVVRGIRLEGLDYTTGNADLAVAANGDSPVFFDVDAIIWQMMVAAMQGEIASGGASWIIGRAIDENITVTAYNADATKPFFRYDAATNQWIYSNDGVSSSPFGTGAGLVGGAGITIAAGTVDVDLTDTTVFVSVSSGAGDSGKVPRVGAGGQFAVGFIPSGTDASKIPLAIVTTKGDIIAATGNATPVRFAVGVSDGMVLTVNSATATGLEYQTPFTTEYKNGTNVFDYAAANHTETIPHGLGRLPRSVKIQTMCGTFASGLAIATLSSDAGGTTSQSMGQAAQAAGGTTLIIHASGTQTQTGTVTFDATNISIAWVLANSNATNGNVVTLWEVEG